VVRRVVGCILAGVVVDICLWLLWLGVKAKRTEARCLIAEQKKREVTVILRSSPL